MTVVKLNDLNSSRLLLERILYYHQEEDCLMVTFVNGDDSHSFEYEDENQVEEDMKKIDEAFSKA